MPVVHVLHVEMKVLGRSLAQRTIPAIRGQHTADVEEEMRDRSVGHVVPPRRVRPERP